MSNEKSKPDDKSQAATVAVIVSSPAAEKLAEAVKGILGFPQNVLEFIAGPNRVRAIGQARADNAVSSAKAQSEIELLRAQTAGALLDREMRNQRNKNAIIREATKALPSPDAKVSEDPISEDFIYRFFEESQGISDENMQRVWGALLAGEVVKPGSFSPRTLSIVKDMQPKDAELFNKLCRFVWIIEKPTPLVFEANGPIYRESGIQFETLSQLQSLGLISFANVAGLQKSGLPEKFVVGYGPERVTVELRSGTSNLVIGSAVFTEAGEQLATLSKAQVVPGFKEFVSEKWRNDGHVIDGIAASAA